MKLLYRGVIPLLFVLLVLLLAGGGWYLRVREREIYRDIEDSINTIAEQKRDQIVQWREERLANARAIMRYPFLSEAVGRYLRQPNSALEKRILSNLRAISEGHRYRDVQLLDPMGKVHLALSSTNQWLHEDARPALEHSLRSRQVMLLDLHEHPGDHTPVMELLAPLFADDPATGSPIGGILIQIDARQFIFPLTQSWPAPSRTAETLFLRRDGNDVLYLNELRNQTSSSTLHQRVPLSRGNTPAVRAVLGEQGVIRTRDYRGVPVIAALKAIPQSPWFLVAKIDEVEALDSWHKQRALMIGVLIILELAVGAAIGMAWMQRNRLAQLAASEQALRESEELVRARARELEDNEERFRKLFENSAEPVLLIENGRVIDGNRASLSMLHMVSVDQIRNRRITDFSPILQPDGRLSEQKQSEIEQIALARGAYTYEWEYIRSDGEHFAVEVVLTAILHRDRHLFHSVWRDLTERRDTERRLQGLADLNEKLIGAATLGIIAYDAAGGCVLANEAAAQAKGATVPQLLRQNFRHLESWKVSGLLPAAETVLASGQPQRLEVNFTSSFHKNVWADCMLVRFISQERAHLLLIFNDISEHKRIAVIREQLSSIIESTADFVSTCSPEGKVLFLNGAARRMLGWGEKEEPGALSLAQVHPPAALKLLTGQGIPTAVREGTWVGETEFLDRQGREITHSVVIIAHRNRRGELEMMSTVARDISAQKQMERIMRARIRLLEQAGACSLDEFLTLAVDEIERETKSTIGFYHFVAPDEETLTLQAWSSNTVQNMCQAEGKGQHYPVAEAGIWCDCVRLRRPVIHNDYTAVAHRKGLPSNHARVERELVLPLMRNQKIVAILGVGNKAAHYDQRDVETVQILGDFSWEIVERKKAEAQMAASDARFRELFAKMEEGFALHEIITDDADRPVNYRCIDVNPAFEKLTGIPRERWIGHTMQDVLPDNGHRWIEVFGRVALSGESVRFDNYVPEWQRWFEVHAFSPGRRQFAVLVNEVTEKKRLEAKQERLLANLSRSNTDLEQFAYVASHDLKSPLRAIDSLASWLQEDLQEVLTGESRQHFDLLRQRTHRMEQLLDDLLAYSRAGRTPAEIAEVSLGALVHEIVDLIAPPAGFTIEMVEPAPFLVTAVTPLRQVLTNLIANAIKHHDRADGIIKVSAREDGPRWEFAVSDDGPGIPAEFHERIFGMFQTLRPRDEVEGSGIGLALVRRIVTRYGGKVTVECPPPRGTVFRFSWPKTISQDDSDNQ